MANTASPSRRSLAPSQFEHKTKIGQTQTTVVHLVTSNHGEVAIKHPARHETLGRDVFKTFQQEASQWAHLDDHNHIVGVVDWGTNPLPWLHQEGDMPWIAMEYMDGGDLTGYAGGLSPTGLLWAAEQLADAVWHAHHNGLMHHDLKPANILFKETTDEQWNIPKIADWELARTLLTHSDSIGVTTPKYIAPEQARNETTDQRTDQFQLGIVLYELFTGSYPFVDDSGNAPEAALINGILQNEPIPPSTRRPALPEDVDQILLGMLAKDPDSRYEAMLQVRNAFSNVTDKLGTPSADTHNNEASQAANRLASQQNKGREISSGRHGIVLEASGDHASIRTELADDDIFYLNGIEADIAPGDEVELEYTGTDPTADDIIAVHQVEDTQIVDYSTSQRSEGRGTISWGNGIVLQASDSELSIKTDLADDGVFYLNDIEAQFDPGQEVYLYCHSDNPDADDVLDIRPADSIENPQPSAIGMSLSWGRGIVLKTNADYASIKTELADDGVFYLNGVEADIDSGDEVELEYIGTDPTANDIIAVYQFEDNRTNESSEGPTGSQRDGIENEGSGYDGLSTEAEVAISDALENGEEAIDSIIEMQDDL